MALTKQREFGPGTGAILGFFDGPKTVRELEAKLGVSKQAVHQKLRRLVKQGSVRRVKSYGWLSRHLYLPTALVSATGVECRIADLRPIDVRVLSALRSDTPSAAPDIAQAVGYRWSLGNKQAARLEKLGLITLTRAGRVRLLRITKEGIEHPQYQARAPKARAYRGVQRTSQRAVNIMLLLHALGKGRTVDLTLLTRFRTPADKTAGTAQVVQRLKRGGYIEKLPNTSSLQPPYRLTKLGSERVASLVGKIPFPDPANVRRRLRDELTRFSEGYSRRHRSRAHKSRDGALPD
jgi:DNA-binding MarR family transcriptional regulator